MKNYGLLLLAFTAAFFKNCHNAGQQPAKPVAQAKHHLPKKTKTAPADTLCIAAVGDMMLGTAYPNTTTLPPDSARHSLDAVKPFFKDADVRFANLEGTLLSQGTPAFYKRDKKGAFLFMMPPQYTQIIKRAGFNTLSLANNHIGDFGDPGRRSTLATLDSAGIYYAGLLSHPDTVFTTRGVKIGFCAFAPNANTVSLLQLNQVSTRIAALKQRADVVLVSFHGGGEGVLFEHVPMAMETYLGEKRGDVHAFAHTAIDAGADVVVGNGPHVARGMELYKNRLIAYSLGNFCTYRCVSVAGVCGLAPILKVYVNRQGKFLRGRLIAMRQDHQTGLVLDTLNRAIKRIKTLTEEDFGDPGITIDNKGYILPN